MAVTIIRAVRAFAWSGAAVFVLALGVFLFSYLLRFATIEPGPPRAIPIAIDVVLFSIFALHHSVFARERVRDWVTRHVPPGLERSFYVWVASVLLIGVVRWWQPVGGVAWSVDGWAWWALHALQLWGVWLTIRSAAIIDVFDLAGVRQSVAAGPPARPRPAAPTEFKTTGPYGWVRHPIYSGWFLLVFGVGTMTGTRLVFAVISCLYVLIAIPLEERSLLATTAGAYNRYVNQVKWKLLPGVY
jgi:protein-S-isoprenylcysteine O-methyltransferase Ste14